ncbi:type II secretion system protein G [Anaerohalosphaera lusitana]|uniref:Type II secretion system protein G n=1 Tax=Anaerohalosphaera lusitana TaxID=1936003 RepID=A0A1U9NJ92_9BACT|nr:type II secretion system protein [Anaerohalosphaera lusitana]AQT67586.1 type II secretion system protein G [Anaerohalosphaera lusitana]
MNKKAFTLIELLVVISIIALLLAIMMPALGVVKQKAQGVVCTSRLKNLLIAYRTYTAENDGKLPSAYTMHPDLANTQDQADYYRTSWAWSPTRDDGSAIDWSQAQSGTVEEKINGIENGSLWPYIKDAEAYHCAADKRYTKPAEEPGWEGMGGYRSYSIPAGLNGPWQMYTEDRVYTKLSQIRRPSNVYAFIEETEGRGFNINSWALAVPEVDPGVTTEWTDPIAIMHNEASTLGFADGHAVIHKWRGKTTLEMGYNQTVRQFVDPDDEASMADLIYMREHFPYK